MAKRTSAASIAAARTEKPYTTRTRLEQERAALLKERLSFDSHWKEIADFVRPRRQRFQITDKNRGDRRNQNIINGTAKFASRTLASGLHAGMSSPARPWFKSTIMDEDLARFKPVQEYLEEVTSRMQKVYAASNLYQSLPTLYGDEGDFGTGCMALLPDTKDLFRTKVFPIGSYAIGLDARGLATTFVRDYQLSVLQIVQEFGVITGYRDVDWSRISTQVKTMWDRGDYQQQVPITWVITPNADADPQRAALSRFMPWASCHFEQGEGKDKNFLKESGYKSFPILVPRWEVTDEDTYGTGSPGIDALGDVKSLQIMEKEGAKALQKMVTPPMVGSPELRNQKTTVLPGEVTYVRDVQHGFKAAYEVRLDYGQLEGKEAQVEYRIQRAYYEDLFLMLARTDALAGDPAKTATEIAERKEEKMLALGPTLERNKDELFDPMYDRVFEMMTDAGLLPEPPDELEGMSIKPENTSILAQAQKLVGVNAQDRLLTTIASAAAVWPEARHKLNINRSIDNYGQMYGTDPGILRTDEEVKALVDAEAQAQQAAQLAENAKNLGAGVKSAADAKVNSGSALDALAGAP